MKRLSLIMVLFVALALLLAGCSAAATPSPTPSPSLPPSNERLVSTSFPTDCTVLENTATLKSYQVEAIATVTFERLAQPMDEAAIRQALKDSTELTVATDQAVSDRMKCTAWRATYKHGFEEDTTYCVAIYLNHSGVGYVFRCEVAIDYYFGFDDEDAGYAATVETWIEGLSFVQQ